ncbi:hypothetical protein [Psychrobium sp. 1_MG-2023]|uniref:hypothetical protein n=1 Tax=Psychrobium sp. 1_MG-2023 TaxID=3062624 RepID=UPI000C34C502|nr:hypothetical protein [Psychrobium sp. 1_MG-2023]MDP2560074.1 hypothetical protein [Psychrobium sp. 1_MG-2023]PKF56266.1 hypothetical protein CW748_09885 [Alteromonadales bacterium alter-6D02]
MLILIPYFLALLSVICAAVIHYKMPNEFFKATAIATTITVFSSVFCLFLFQDNLLEMAPEGVTASIPLQTFLLAAGLSTLYGVLIALLVGYFVKAIRAMNA